MELATPTRHLEGLKTEEVYSPDELLSHEPSVERAFLIGELALGKQKVLTPTDSLTGIPLPVYPRWRKLSHSSEDNNWHHHYHKSTDKSLTSQDGLAVRHSRLQLLPIRTHNKYHSIFEGPALPRTNAERFGHIVLLGAGYIPRKALDVYADDPTVPVQLSDKQLQRLHSNREIQMRGHSNVSNFMKRYLARQDLSHVNENIIDEFLHTGDVNRKQFLGHWLLAMASEVAIEPIASTYRQALDEGLITGGDQKLPNIVKSYVNGRKTSKRALTLLYRNLKRRAQSKDYLQTEVNGLQFSG